MVIRPFLKRCSAEQREGVLTTGERRVRPTGQVTHRLDSSHLVLQRDDAEDSRRVEREGQENIVRGGGAGNSTSWINGSEQNHSISRQ